YTRTHTCIFNAFFLWCPKNTHTKHAYTNICRHTHTHKVIYRHHYTHTQIYIDPQDSSRFGPCCIITISPSHSYSPHLSLLLAHTHTHTHTPPPRFPVPLV